MRRGVRCVSGWGLCFQVQQTLNSSSWGFASPGPTKHSISETSQGRHKTGVCSGAGPRTTTLGRSLQGLPAPLAAVSKRMAKRNQLVYCNFSDEHSNTTSDSSSAGLWGPSVCYYLLFSDSEDISLLELPNNHHSQRLKHRSSASPSSGARSLRSSQACSF